MIGAGAASGIFHALAAAGRFDRLHASLALAALALAARGTARGRPALAGVLRRDASKLARWLRAGFRGPTRLVQVGLAALGLLTTARVLVTPPLAWDTLTYHAVKAATWVQTGGSLPMLAPGGWSTHRDRLGGAELFGAWAMLPYHADALYAAVDLVWWGGLALALFALGRELGVRARHRAAAIAYVSFVPALYPAVGSGYVELPLTTFLCVALLFAVRYRRERAPAALALAGAAAALVASVKLTAALAALVVGAALLTTALSELRHGSRRRATLGALLAAAAAWTLIFLPWPLRNALETGHPLSVPLRLGPLQLGAPNPDLEWLNGLIPTGPWLLEELEGLSRVFGSPLELRVQLTLLALLPLGWGLVNAVRRLRRPGLARWSAGLLLLTIASVLALYFHPQFTAVRLHWADHNGRLWMPAFAPAVLLATAGGRRGRGSPGLRAFLLAAAVLHALRYTGFGWPSGSAPGIAALALGLAAAAAASLARPALVPAASLALIGLVTGWAAPASRQAQLERGYLLHYTPKFWAEPAAHLDALPRGARVAVTSGPKQHADTWLMYPLMGSRLQNSLHYVPVTADGAVAPMAPGAGREERAHPGIWARRLREREIDYVMCFQPTALELRWLEARPDRFERIAGDRASWGLYRVRRP